MSLDFVDIGHRYGDTTALADVSLSASPGEITCLLGPSGCGKTTLLHLAAGLLELQQGEVRLDGEILAAPSTNPPPEARPVGLVFQEGALFPHLTVAENIGFGVRDQASKGAAVTSLLTQIGLVTYADRYPHTLSGGQQQRVALARAIAPAPRVLLLDEPFANVDIVLRRTLREETRDVLIDRGAVAVLVTHDPEEAMEIGDKIAVMSAGRIVQIGTPEALYDAPSAASVGALIGGGQIVKAERMTDGLVTAFGSWPLTCMRDGAPDHGTMDLLVRPDALDVQAQGTDGCIIDVRRTGLLQRLTVVAPSGERLAVHVARDSRFSAGQSVGITPKDKTVFAFPTVQS